MMAGDGDAAAAVQATPRKQTAPSSPESTRRPGHTPMSSSKRRMLDGFATPLKRHDGNAKLGPGGGISFAARVGLGNREATTPRGPGSASRLQFATPAFLKRAGAPPLPSLDENGEYLASPPQPLRLPRKPLTRGLSSIVAGLRKLEEEALDEELEVMREMEMEEEEGRGPPVPKLLVEGRPSAERENIPPTAGEDGAMPGNSAAPVEVEDSQVQATNLLGGFDDEGAYDSPVEGGMDRGRPLRVFKKKGQKRTTRLVKMKPTRTRRPTDDSEDDADEEAIPETQFDATKIAEDRDPLDAGSGSEFDGSDSEEDAMEMAKKAEKKKATAKANVKAKTKKEKAEGKDEGVVKRTARKVKATAHANFKRLKLRNNGAKGGPGYNSKFRRRR